MTSRSADTECRPRPELRAQRKIEIPLPAPLALCARPRCSVARPCVCGADPCSRATTIGRSGRDSTQHANPRIIAFMKFALVDGTRLEAQPKLSAKCPICSDPMVSKCGKVRIWHWAHQGTLPCDPWWENETEWHRNWKGQFPINWQEFVYRAENGEKHVADVRTDHGWVIEYGGAFRSA